MKHKRLVQRAKDAIAELFADSSVSPETTRDDLEGLVERLGILLEAIECDIEDQA